VITVLKDNKSYQYDVNSGYGGKNIYSYGSGTLGYGGYHGYGGYSGYGGYGGYGGLESKYKLGH